MGNARSFKRRGSSNGSSDSGSVAALGVADRRNKPSILWYANAPWAGTGYGTQTAQVVKRISQQGFDIACHVNYGFEAGNTQYNLDGQPLTIYGSGFGQWRNDAITANAQHYGQITNKSPLVITLCDVWTFGKDVIAADIPVWSWTPVDHAPIPPNVARWFERPNTRAIAMSKFGKAMFEGAGIDCDYVPHAFEPVFQPVKALQGADGVTKSPRELMSIGDDRFVVMMNAANKGIVPNRKSFGQNLLAFSIFAKKHDDALLYLHTEQFGAMGGIDLTKLVKAVGIPEHQVKFVDQFAYRNQIPNQILAGLYSMSDVLLSVSMGEGFGIPVIEAQACGTPVIVSDWTAQPELCGDGWIVETQPDWDPMQDSWFATPLVSSIVDALEQAYNSGGGHSQKAVDWAQDYNADVVFKTGWLPLLEKL
ncbi:glycosyltransferase [bacterium]|nr:glycosyltransferase [bacterium]